jgi:hypothetical protein
MEWSGFDNEQQLATRLLSAQLTVREELFRNQLLPRLRHEGNVS